MTEREVDRCLTILSTLLNCAEEAAYPSMLHLVDLLQAGENHSQQSWPHIWQAYLSGQLMLGPPVLYQNVALLWAALFPAVQDIKQLAILISDHVTKDGMPVQRSAYHFLAMLSYSHRDLRTLQALQGHLYESDAYWQNARGYTSLQYEPNGLSPRTLRDLQGLHPLQPLQSLRHLQNLRYLRDIQDLRNIRNPRDLSYEQTKLIFLNLANCLLTHEMAERVLQHLAHIALVPPADSAEIVDILVILLGRVLQIREANEIGDAVEQELRQLAYTACSGTITPNPEEVEIRLEIVRTLPTRSAKEVTLVMQLAEETMEVHLHQACAQAIRYATPLTQEAWDTLEEASQSFVPLIADAAVERLKQRK